MARCAEPAPGATDEDNLIRNNTLDPVDRLEREPRRRSQNKLGFAIQLCVMRQTGRLLGQNDLGSALLEILCH
nr:DUF4158 domain-containing protein [Mesorhizobium soli]